MADLDQGGTFRQRTRLIQGPSVGPYDAPDGIVRVTAGGTFIVPLGTFMVVVNFNGAVTLQLPAFKPVYPAITIQGPNTLTELYIVDEGGFASLTNTITILPASGELIDGLTSRQLLAPYAAFRLQPDPVVGGCSTTLVSGTSLLFTQGGTGALTRTVDAKLKETFSVTDFDNATDAITAGIARTIGTIHVPGGLNPGLPATFNNITLDYDGPATPSNLAFQIGNMVGKKLYRSQDAGNHASTQHHAILVETNPVGSGTNGPTSTDSGIMIVNQKQNFQNSGSAAAGQLDGLMVYLRQGGPQTAGGVSAQSDCAALECDVRILQKSGFACMAEMVTVVEDSVGTQLRGIDVQIGGINTLTTGDLAIGMLVNSVFAPCNIAYLAQEDSSQGVSSWNSAFSFVRNDSVTTYNVDRNGNVVTVGSYGFTDGTALDDLAWTAFTPTVVLSGGTATATGSFKHVGKLLFFQMAITCTGSGTFTSATLPANANSRSFFAGREMARTGVGWVGWSTAASNLMSAGLQASNTASLQTNDILAISGVYEST